jgi:TatA/E family protein of Tat protein translocase
MSFLPNVAFLTDSAGAGEWIVLFVVILIVVGPKRLPEVVRKIGRTMEMFRRAADEFKDQLMTMDQPVTPPQQSLPPDGTTAKTDADGLPHADTSASNVVPPGPDVYPDVADYPGNEDQVAGSTPVPESQPVAPAASVDSSKTPPPGETPKAATAPSVASSSDKPAEGRV